MENLDIIGYFKITQNQAITVAMGSFGNSTGTSF